MQEFNVHQCWLRLWGAWLDAFCDLAWGGQGQFKAGDCLSEEACVNRCIDMDVEMVRVTLACHTCLSHALDWRAWSGGIATSTASTNHAQVETATAAGCFVDRT
jgi:hypothetical protein